MPSAQGIGSLFSGLLGVVGQGILQDQDAAHKDALLQKAQGLQAIEAILTNPRTDPSVLPVVDKMFNDFVLSDTGYGKAGKKGKGDRQQIFSQLGGLLQAGRTQDVPFGNDKPLTKHLPFYRSDEEMIAPKIDLEMAKQGAMQQKQMAIETMREKSRTQLQNEKFAQAQAMLERKTADQLKILGEKPQLQDAGQTMALAQKVATQAVADGEDRQVNPFTGDPMPNAQDRAKASAIRYQEVTQKVANMQALQAQRLARTEYIKQGTQKIAADIANINSLIGTRYTRQQADAVKMQLTDLQKRRQEAAAAMDTLERVATGGTAKAEERAQADAEWQRQNELIKQIDQRIEEVKAGAPQAGANAAPAAGPSITRTQYLKMVMDLGRDVADATIKRRGVTVRD